MSENTADEPSLYKTDNNSSVNVLELSDFRFRYDGDVLRLEELRVTFTDEDLERVRG